MKDFMMCQGDKIKILTPLQASTNLLYYANSIKAINMYEQSSTHSSIIDLSTKEDLDISLPNVNLVNREKSYSLLDLLDTFVC